MRPGRLLPAVRASFYGAVTYSPTFAVPSARRGLTSLFGMGRGGSHALSDPTRYRRLDFIPFSARGLGPAVVPRKGTAHGAHASFRSFALTGDRHNRHGRCLTAFQPLCLFRKAVGRLVPLGFDVAVFTPAAYLRRRLRRPSLSEILSRGGLRA